MPFHLLSSEPGMSCRGFVCIVCWYGHFVGTTSCSLLLSSPPLPCLELRPPGPCVCVWGGVGSLSPYYTCYIPCSASRHKSLVSAAPFFHAEASRIWKWKHTLSRPSAQPRTHARKGTMVALIRAECHSRRHYAGTYGHERSRWQKTTLSRPHTKAPHPRTRKVSPIHLQCASILQKEITGSPGPRRKQLD